MEYIPFDTHRYIRSKRTLYRTLSVPSISNSYAQAIQFAKDWFLSKLKAAIKFEFCKFQANLFIGLLSLVS